MNGNEIFSNQVGKTVKIKSVAVNLDGDAFVGRKTIYAISKDGKQARPVFSHSVKLNSIRDLCFDKSGKRLFVFGFEFIEIYDQD